MKPNSIINRANDGGIRTVVDEWINHIIIGEPPGTTAFRKDYVKHQLTRCLRILDLVPNPHERKRLLELGSGIYLMTFLLMRLRNYDLEMVQYWSMPNGDYDSTLRGWTDYRSARWRKEQIFLVAEKAEYLNRKLPDFLYEKPEFAKPLIEAVCRPRSTP